MELFRKILQLWNVRVDRCRILCIRVSEILDSQGTAIRTNAINISMRQNFHILVELANQDQSVDKCLRENPIVAFSHRKMIPASETALIGPDADIVIVT